MTGAGGREPRTALFVVSVDWFFLSHRLAVARRLRAEGWDVWVAATDTGRLTEVEAEGMTPVALPFTRWGAGPVEQVRALWFLFRLYRRLRPRLVHHVAPKPVILGSLAARFVPGVAVVNAVTGFGLGGGESRRARWLRLPLRLLYRLALSRRRSFTIFQNRDDLDGFVERGTLPADRARLILGSGVDPDVFTDAVDPDAEPLVVFASRMLYEKGVETFVDAARRVRATRPDVRCALVGVPDEGNPDSVPVDQLETWAAEGAVEWWGRRDDMPAVLGSAWVVALPTHYREGLPKVLIEAASCGRATVASDVPGCREIVRHEVTGLLVPPRDPPATADAVLRLLDDDELRRRLGREGRALVLREMTLDRVVDQTFAVYTDALALTP